jgi:hypothetical protein
MASVRNFVMRGKSIAAWIIFLLFVNAGYGLQPRLVYGKHGDQYLPVEALTEKGGLVRIDTDAIRTIPIKDLRIVPAGDAFADVRLTIEVLKTRASLNNRSVIIMHIEADRPTQGLMLIGCNQQNEMSCRRLPELQPGKPKRVEFTFHGSIIMPINLMVFAGNQEVDSNLRIPRRREDKFNLDGDADRPVQPFIHVTPSLERRLRMGSHTARVEVQIDAWGLVTDARVLETSNKEYELVVAEAALRRQFIPQVRDGVRTPATVILPYRHEWRQ